MKIEWLNDEMTEARVTRGWWRKETAHIRRISAVEWQKQPGSCWWRFIPSDRHATSCGGHVEAERQSEMQRRAAIQDWQPVATMPAARVVRR